MTPLHGIACFCDIGFGARAVSRKTPIFFIRLIKKQKFFFREASLTSIIMQDDLKFYLSEHVRQGFSIVKNIIPDVS